MVNEFFYGVSSTLKVMFGGACAGLGIETLDRIVGNNALGAEPFGIGLLVSVYLTASAMQKYCLLEKS